MSYIRLDVKMAYEERRLSGLMSIVNMEDPERVLEEVKVIDSLMFPEFNFGTLNKVFEDIVKLFHGEYPGYQACNTEYHDLKHTTDAFLAMARLIHGAWVDGKKLNPEQVNLGLICSLMHDTGYIQKKGDRRARTGAAYTSKDSERSIEFMNRYITDNGSPRESFRGYRKILKCTGLDKEVSKMKFDSWQIELLGKMLGTADLLGQMADGTYLEKLLFLFYEFREGKVRGFDSELDLLKKTPGFWEMAQQRFASQLGNVNEYMLPHFKARWKLDRDLYKEAIENNINYLNSILKNHEKDYREHLNRGGLVEKLPEVQQNHRI